MRIEEGPFYMSSRPNKFQTRRL